MGKEKRSLGLEGELTFLLGGMLKAEVFFDDETWVIGTQWEVGATAGVKASAGIVAESSDEVVPAENNIDFTGTVDASTELGPVSVEKDLAQGADQIRNLFKEGEVAGGDTTAGSDVSDAGIKPKLKPKLGLGASAAIKGRMRATTSIVPDTINAALEVVEEICWCKVANR